MGEFPRLVVAGTNSGVGKTTITLAVVAAFKRRGLKVQTFKVGPDYLDPTYLSIASERPCFNLDSWMTDTDYIQTLFSQEAAEADISIIEGVMGLFDGSDPVTRAGSTSEVAAKLKSPVLLIVNTHGMAKSIAALVKGFSEFDPEVKISGVIANRCGTPRHVEWMRNSLTAFDLPGISASFPREVFPPLPSRHLGLVTADRQSFSVEILDKMANIVEEHADLDAIVEIARSAEPLHVPGRVRVTNATISKVRLGIARDEAFHFYYPDNLGMLKSNGCELIEFSPIRDEELPPDLAGIYLGGGYPEEYAVELSQNESMIREIRKFAESDKPIYAECGGLMYLSDGIELRDGRYFPMTGIFPVKTRMLEKLKSLGYVEIVLGCDSILGKTGAILRGHEFHYSEIQSGQSLNGTWCSAYNMRYRRSDHVVEEGFQKGRILATYVHAHFASNPEAARHFVQQCRS